MSKKLNERVLVLKMEGVNVDKFHLDLNGDEIQISNIAQGVVEDRQVGNDKLFRRWVMAQTFKMLYEPSWNSQTKKHETGWDNYLRNKYDYKYQFDMMLEELRVLNKLENKDNGEFVERAHFFNKYVVVDTCEHYLRHFNSYVMKNMDKKTKTVKLESKYGTVGADGFADIVCTLKLIIEDMKSADNYAELYTYLKKFIKKMNKLPYNTAKCPAWKDAFKGSGAFYTLKNMILFHNCLLRNCATKQESLELLIDCLEYYKGEYWRFHYMLLDTIEFNNFDLRESIRKNS